MQEMTFEQCELAAGGSERGMDMVYNGAAGAFAGGCAGFLMGGPFGAIAGAISGGGHAMFVTYAMR